MKEDLSLKEFIPETRRVAVGEKVLTLKEFSVAKRDAALTIVLGALDVEGTVRPLVDALTRGSVIKDESGNPVQVRIDFAVVVSKIRDVILRLMGGALTQVFAFTLDTAENRAVVGVKDADLQVDKEFGYEFSPAMARWIRENLTARQEPAVLDAVMEINDFAGIAKKYASLVMGAATRQDRRQEKEPEAPAG